MDWELYQRHRATLLLLGVTALSFLLLIFQKTAAVRHLRSFLVIATLPTERFLSDLKAPALAPTPTAAGPAAPGGEPVAAAALPEWAVESEARRLTRTLEEENRRLRELLQLKERRWPSALAAHVVGRDPQRWFQEIVLDKGKQNGLTPDDPVVAIADGKEGLVGRVTEVSEHVSKVMLIQDSLSAVAATVLGTSPEDGVVEGSNSHELTLKYLDRGSHAKIGDPVVTSGLGGAFPEGIPIGWIEDLSLDQRQLFVQARLRPALRTNQLHVVLILLPPAAKEGE